MKVSIIGTGYVGLVSGVCLADVGNQVICLDNDEEKIKRLKNGETPIYEPGLDKLLRVNTEAERLTFTTSVAEAVAESDVIFIAVGTPPGEDGSADLSHVLAVADEIGQVINEPRLIATKSTVPVGTAVKVRRCIQQRLDHRDLDINFSVASNPEFLKEGAAINDFMRPDRIVVGTDDEFGIDLLRQLYAPFARNHEKFLVMDIASAELTKYAANAMLATKISFMNELSNIADLLGADVELVRQGIGSDPRIGYEFIYPGCGYGGSCFPKDVQALARTATAHGYEPQLLQAVEAVNLEQKTILGKKLVARFGEQLNGLNIAIWGLAFKPNTDDMREAPSLVLIDELLRRGAQIKAYDPVASDHAKALMPAGAKIDFVDDMYAATFDADALVTVTEWKSFRSPDFERLQQEMKQALIFDGRNIYDPIYLHQLGFQYSGIGRLSPA